MNGAPTEPLGGYGAVTLTGVVRAFVALIRAHHAIVRFIELDLDRKEGA